jgi:hypothetical protein
MENLLNNFVLIASAIRGQKTEHSRIKPYGNLIVVKGDPDGRNA